MSKQTWQKPKGIIDLEDLRYWRGEALAICANIEARIDDMRRKQFETDDAAQRRAYADAIKDLEGEKQRAKRVCDSVDELQSQYVTFSDGITTLRAAWQSSAMRPLIGYLNYYSTDSRLEAEATRRAAISTGCKYSVMKWDDGFYAMQIRIPVTVIEMVEAEGGAE